MADVNKAMIAKLGWRLITNEDSMWSRALLAKYCRRFDYLSASERGGKSWIWRSLLQVRDIIKAGLCWQVRNGAQLNIWCTLWVPGIANFIPQLQEGALVDRHLNCVKDLMRADSTSWNEALIRSLFEPQSAAAILQISLPSSPVVDVPLWTLEPKGNLSVKAAYEYIIKCRSALAGSLSSKDWEILWKVKIQHRLKLILWKVAGDALPLRGKIKRWAENASNLSWRCPLCDCDEESNEHLFPACPGSKFIWREGPWPVRTEAFARRPIAEWIKFLFHCKNLPSELQNSWRDIMLAVAIRLDVIWYARNQVAHGKDRPVPDSLINEVHRWFEEHQMASADRMGDTVQLWKPPALGHMKINYDVAMHDGYLVWAVICRNSDGRIVQARASNIAGTNPLKGEARAARMACETASYFLPLEVTIEGDCLNLVNQVDDVFSTPDWVIAGEVYTIRSLLRDNAKWHFVWVSREANIAAHNLAQWCSQRRVFGDICIQDLPPEVSLCDHADLANLPS